jgi:hypothetical protein
LLFARLTAFAKARWFWKESGNVPYTIRDAPSARPKGGDIVEVNGTKQNDSSVLAWRVEKE